MLRPVSNPPNPFLSSEVEYLEEIPNAALEVYEDHTREILSHNDSPDVGFEWSVNPYRGCQHACSYCLQGSTLILMGDGSTKPIRDLKAGDVIYGTTTRGASRRYVRTRVLDHWSTLKPAVRVTLEDGTTLVASPDHRFLTTRGWKQVSRMNAKHALRGVGGCATLRERDLEGVAIERHLRVKSVESLGVVLPMFDITTGTGDFIAEGIVSHNCFARPTHEYLGLGAGSDFDTKITLKPEAPKLLREAFEKRSWKGDLVVFSGVTDCYQPLEASYRLTRGCLEVCLEYKNPVGIITKAALIERDLELLVALGKVTRVGVSVSIPFWNKEHARLIEPYVPSPQRRIQTVQRLAEAGLDVSVMVAPIIPGLTDSDMVRILEAAKAAGARRAGYVFLRLPGSVAPVFENRLREAIPLRADRVMSRVREARGGNLYDPRFGARQTGQGNYAQMIAELFAQTVRRLGLDEERYEAFESTFARPGRGRQLPLL